MRNWVIWTAAVLAAGTLPAHAQDAASMPKRWGEAFAAGDIAAAVALYHEGATFVGPRSKEVGRDREAARGYLSTVFGASTERSTTCGEPIVKPRGDATVVAGVCQLSVAFKDGKKLASPVRYHMVIQKSGASFVITDHHLSLVPAD
jgi:ketosteroid isomerase-like protein